MTKNKYTQKAAATFGVSVALMDARSRGSLSSDDTRFLTALEKSEYIRLGKEELNLEWFEPEHDG
jgi:hypothetical protein